MQSLIDAIYRNVHLAIMATCTVKEKLEAVRSELLSSHHTVLLVHLIAIRVRGGEFEDIAFKLFRNSFSFFSLSCIVVMRVVIIS